LRSGDDKSGVRTANAASTRAAVSISAGVTGSVEDGCIIHDLYRVPRRAGKTA
jgi:hypothetical protein